MIKDMGRGRKKGAIGGVVTYFLALEAVREIRHRANMDEDPPPASPEELR